MTRFCKAKKTKQDAEHRSRASCLNTILLRNRFVLTKHLLHSHTNTSSWLTSATCYGLIGEYLTSQSDTLMD